MRSSILSVTALPLAASATGLIDQLLGGSVDKLIPGGADKILNNGAGKIVGGSVEKVIDGVVGTVDKATHKVTQKVFEATKFDLRENIIQFPLTTNEHARNAHMRRQLESGLDNRKTGFFYTIDIEIGTPAQKVAVNLDTGSSELWVNPNCDKASDPAYCKSFGAMGVSSTWVDTNQTSHLKYGRGSADIKYGYDYVTIGTSKLNQQIFGVAQDSEFATTGIMGVGPNLHTWDSPYPFVLDNLYTQNFIKSRAFSLDLRHVENSRGAIVFGGIDTKKFKGPLVKKNIVPAAQSPDQMTRYWGTCDSISINKEDGTTADIISKPQAFLFDSGFTVSALPTAAFNELLKAFPSAKEQGNTGQYTVDCSTASAKGSLDFKFGEATINVPYSDFIWQQPDYNACVLGAVADDKTPVLGDTFLRSAYVVFDWDNRALHFAASDDCGSNLIAIGSGPNAVSVTEGDCGKPEPTSSSTTSSATSTAPTSSATSTAPTSSANSTAPISSATPTAPTASASLGFPTLNATSTKAPFSSGVFTTGGPLVTGGAGKEATTLTSAITSTRVHTITSCAPTVTNCPVGKVVTEVVTDYTTWCPEQNQPKPTSTSTSAYTKPPCSEVVLTFVIPKTYYCTQGQPGCKAGEPIVTSVPATMAPITPAATATPIPGCKDCHPKAEPKPSATPSAAVPTGVVPVPVNPKPVETKQPVPPTSSPVAPAQPPVTPSPKPVKPSTMASIKPTGTGAPVTSQPPIAAGAAGLYIPGLAAMVAALVAAM